MFSLSNWPWRVDHCVDYHSGDARAAGEDERRIWAVAAWRDNPLFDERERAALALTDAVTRLPEGGVPDDVYATRRGISTTRSSGT